MDGASEWLLVSASTGKSATLRVFVWRQMRRLGAVHVGPSVGFVPKRAVVVDAVSRMVDRVRADGGSARVVTAVLGPSDESELIAEQRADRDREYAEVLERVPAFMAEIETETARGRATYTEVEESEADLARFERWLGSIQRRDYFDAPAGRTAEQAVQGCREALERFEAAAVEADTNDRSPAGRGVPTDGEPK